MKHFNYDQRLLIQRALTLGWSFSRIAGWTGKDRTSVSREIRSHISGEGKPARSNGGKPKIDIRDWNATHERMGRGITLTEEQGEKLVKALGQRMLDKQKVRAERDPYER